MRKAGLGRRAVLVLGTGLVTGCAGGGIWPFGGGGGGGEAATAAGPVEDGAGMPAVADGTALLPAVRMAAAERGRQGVILRAEGIAPIQGFHSPELRPAGRSAEGIETLELRAVGPLGAEAVGPERTRLLSVGRFYSNTELRDIRGFRVVAAGNSVLATVP